MDFTKLYNQTILITGATGLIGKNIIKELLRLNHEMHANIKIIAVVRNKEKAERIFGCNDTEIFFAVGDIRTIQLELYDADYIIHTASQTSSRSFVEHPVETIGVAIDGTRNLLEYARRHRITQFIYLSTMEVYGTPQTDDKIGETHATNLDTMQVRSCYPESKRMCENLCISYATEYQIPINVLRLTQTFGQGVEYNDGRVFAVFARCCIERKDIILKTSGETKRCYLHINDAVDAVFTVLLSDSRGEAYNVANEATYCSIREMAEMVANEISGGNINVKIELDESTSLGYAPTLRMNLDTSKIRRLGWNPRYGLDRMFSDLIASMRESMNG